jgi:hypothetical protein
MTWGVLAGRQTTLQDHVTVAGVGVHSGRPATVALHPAEANTGIVFLRSGIEGQPDRELNAHFHSVTATEFATVLGDKNGPGVSTTEHILAAFRGLGVDNAVIEVDGLTFLIVQFRALPLPRILAAHDWLDRLHRPDGGVPYGIALAAAALIVYPQTEWMTLPVL